MLLLVIRSDKYSVREAYASIEVTLLGVSEPFRRTLNEFLSVSPAGKNKALLASVQKLRNKFVKRLLL